MKKVDIQDFIESHNSQDSSFDAELLNKELASSIVRNDKHVILCLTPKGVIALFRSIKKIIDSGISKREIPAIDNLIPRKEVMLRLSVSHTTLHSWDKNDILKPIKIGNKIFYKAEDVNRIKNR